MDDKTRYSQAQNPTNFTVQILTNLTCNLNCTYCYEVKTGKINTIENITPFIDYMFEENKDNVLGAKEKDVENILVIDTSGTMEDFEKYNTAVFITKKNIMYISDKGKYEIFPLSEVGDVTINRSMVEMVVGNLAPLLNFVFPGLVLFVFIGTFVFIPIGKMTYLLFFALVLWIIAKLMKYVLSFGKAYQMGLHLIVITTTLFGLLSLFKVNITFPFFQTIILSILSIVILSKIRGNETAETTNA